MSKASLGLLFVMLYAGVTVPTHADQKAIRSPERGVLCDRYVCANDEGISRELTEKYLGKRVATKAFAYPDTDRTEFTFANGIFCDVKERLCRQDRYYGADGKRTGAVSEKYTRLLFGNSTAR